MEVIAEISHVYKLEPGDGTRYTFSITRLDNAENVFSGIGNDKYVMVAIYMEGYGGGVCVLGDFQLRKIERDPRFAMYELGYARSRGWQNVNEYTALCILLACIPLVRNPYDTENAIAWMKRTRAMLMEYTDAKDPS